MADIPHPMPVALRDTVEMKLGDRELAALDSNGRFIVRRLIAEAYAAGAHDGWFQHMREAQTDRAAEG